MCRTASVAVRCSRPACSAGSPILGAAAASAVRPVSFRNRLRSSMASSAPTGVAIAATPTPSATVVAAAGTAPEHCLVVGHVDTETKFELRLPTTTWNGKFYHAGGGGFVGSIPTSPGALARGYAVIGTDTGHVGDGPFAPALDGSWALNN